MVLSATSSNQSNVLSSRRSELRETLEGVSVEIEDSDPGWESESTKESVVEVGDYQ